MLAISEHMKSQGYASPSEEHTRIPGIWRKLGTLYNLGPLDERVRGQNYLPIDLLLTSSSYQGIIYPRPNRRLRPIQRAILPLRAPRGRIRRHDVRPETSSRRILITANVGKSQLTKRKHSSRYGWWVFHKKISFYVKERKITNPYILRTPILPRPDYNT